MRTKVIYEDNSIIVAHKPAGLATQTAKVGHPDMVSELKNYLMRSQRAAVNNVTAGAGTAKGVKTESVKTRGDSVYLGVIHRLDQPVEGLLIFAKDKKVAASLTAQLGQGTLNKQYYAVVCGKPSDEEGELVDYLCKEANGVARVVPENSPDKSQDAKRAVLQYKIIKPILGQDVSTEQSIFFMDIHIDTGRFHQIRVQMAHAGMPLLGDSKYGTEQSMALSRQFGVRNVALCAYRLEFTHPATKKKMSFEVKPEGKIFGMSGE